MKDINGWKIYLFNREKKKEKINNKINNEIK